MFTHKKICTSIVGLLSPTFGVQIKPTALYNAPKSAKEFQQQIKKLEQQMYKFAQDLEFEKAAAVRDQLHQLREQFMISE